METLNPIYNAARVLAAFCSAHDWKFCFIGGVAVQRWGEPRFTVDVDITLLTAFGAEKAFAEEILSRFPSRRPDALNFALQTRVLLVEDDNHIPLDIALGAMPFEERTIQRSSPFLFSEGVTLITCSAEDLIIHKAFADRDQDWADVRGVLYRQKGKLDFDLIYKELKPLVELKEEPEILTRLNEKITQCRRYIRE